MEYKKRSDLHIARKIWHSVTVFLMTLGYYFLPEKISGALLITACLIFIPVDFIRLKKPKFNAALLKIFKGIVRSNEVHHLAGTTYLLAGVFVVYLIFSREIILLTLLYLAFADPLASYIGIKYGTIKIMNGKSLQGSLAAFFICAFATWLFMNYHGLLLGHLYLVSLLGGILGAMAEAIPLFKLDDNFSIPVVSATGLWILFSVLGGPI